MATLFPACWKDHVDRLANDINRACEQWLPGGRRDCGEGDETKGPSFWNSCAPVVDVEEDENELRVTAELPGLDKDDFGVEITGDRLTIRGEKKTETEEKKRDRHYSECCYGSFERSLTLPCEIQPEKIEATYTNGVLKLTIPKSEKARSRRIKINIS